MCWWRKNLFGGSAGRMQPVFPESGGTKMHQTRNLLFRNNVVRHIRHANCIWLDIGNTNDRLTGNVFADIPGDVNPHAIQIEGSDALNEIDNNIFDKRSRAGFLTSTTNHVIIAYNLYRGLRKGVRRYCVRPRQAPRSQLTVTPTTRAT